MKWLLALLAAQSLNAQCLEVPITVTEVAVPSEVNKSTEAYVMMSGQFPNSCYKLSRTEVTHPDTFTHEIIAYAQILDEVCLMKIVDFTFEVELGILLPGEHTVIVQSGDGRVFQNKLLVQ
ncbi:MAG: hypothetical protein KF799_12370 [Bdellovibrionales bacterium]|nr:hypothetical protein [Bdellovibrionales bacterium]